jgi:hypothetical protein
MEGMSSGAGDPVLSLWHTRYRQALEYQQQSGAELSWARYWRWYRAFRQPMTQPFDWWRSNEVIPTCFKIVETIFPRHILSMFDSPDWFSVRGTEGMDERWELAIESLMHEQLEEMNIFPTAYEALKYCVIMGHVWGKVIWKEEYQTRAILEPKIAINPETGEVQSVAMSKTTVNEVVADRPDFSYCQLDRIKADPSGKAMWFIEEMDTTLEELETTNERMGGGVYSNLEELRGRGGAGINQLSRSYQEPQSTENIPQTTANPPARDTIGLWQCWGWTPKAARGPDMAEWRLVVIAQKSVVIRDIPAPTPDAKPPYFGIKCIPIPGQLYGESPLKYSGPMVDQQTRLSNMRMDQTYLNVWGQYVYDKSSGITSNEMLFQPGGAIGVNGNPRDAFMSLARQPNLPEAYREDEYREAHAEAAAGVPDLFQGGQETDRPTTGDSQIRLQQGSMRFNAHALWLDQTFKRELLNRTFALLQMRMPKEHVARILGSDGIDYDVTLDLSSIQVPVDFVIGGGLLGISKQQRIDQYQRLVEFGASPIYGPYIRADAVLTDFMREIGKKDIHRYIKTEMEVQQAQMMMGAPQGLGSGVAGSPAQVGGGGPGQIGQGAGAPQLPANAGPSTQGAM